MIYKFNFIEKNKIEILIIFISIIISLPPRLFNFSFFVFIPFSFQPIFLNTSLHSRHIFSSINTILLSLLLILLANNL